MIEKEFTTCPACGFPSSAGHSKDCSLTNAQEKASADIEQDSIWQRCKSEVYAPPLDKEAWDAEAKAAWKESREATWKAVSKDVLFIEKEQFGEDGFTEEDFVDTFTDPDNVIVLMRDSQNNEVVGYTYGSKEDEDERVDIPREDEGERTAYIHNGALRSKYQGHRLVGKLIGRLEEEFRKRGFEFIEEDTAAKNNFAAKTEKAYGDRIVYKGEPHDSNWGQQYFLE